MNYMFICITSLDLYVDFNLHYWLQIITYLSHSSIINWFIIDLPFIIDFTSTKTWHFYLPGSSLSDMGKKQNKNGQNDTYIIVWQYFSTLERLVNFCKTLLLLCRSYFMWLRPLIVWKCVPLSVFEVISYSGQKA